MRLATFGRLACVLLIHGAVQHASAQSNADIGLEGHVFSQKTNKVLPGALVQLTQSVGATNTLLGFTIRADSSGFFFAQLPVAAVDPGDLPTAQNTITVTCNTRRQAYSQAVTFYNPMQFGSVYRRDFYLNVPSNVKSCL